MAILMAVFSTLYTLIAFVSLIYAVMESRRRLRSYQVRACAGRAWLTAFPTARKDDIRAFLRILVSSFELGEKKIFHFRPDDKLMDVYRALYPVGGPDGFEVERFVQNVDATGKILPDETWHPDVTLGEIFGRLQILGNVGL